MREIKFRAWDKELERICEVVKINFLMKTIIVFHLDEGEVSSYLPLTRFELMQYTGLKDKNGKEIYEGDILSWHNYNNVEFLGVVLERPGVTYIDWKKPREYPSYIFESGTSKMEVIGNIYENQDLLEG